MKRTRLAAILASTGLLVLGILSFALYSLVLSELRAQGEFPALDGEKLDRLESGICAGNSRIGAHLGPAP